MPAGDAETVVAWKSKGLSEERNVVNLFIVYKLDVWLRNLSIKFTLGDCLFDKYNW